MGYALRTERWRYIEWGRDATDTQLFDLEADPGETTNYARDPEKAALIAEFRAIVEQERVN